MIQRECALIRMQPPVTDNRGLLYVSGATVPTDGTDGYQTGCLFLHTDGGNNTALYVNEGSVASCTFNAVTTGGPADILAIGAFSSLTAGSGIPLSSTQRSSIVAYGDDNGLSIASSVYNLRTRLLLTVDQDGASIRALMAQLKLADGVDVSTGIYTASQGYLELAGDHSAETGSTLTCFDASLEIGAGNTLTVDNGGEVAGIRVETTGTGTITNNGTCAGVLVDKATGAPDWPVGVYVKDSIVALVVENDLVDTLAGGLLRYGTSAAAIAYTPVSTGSHSGLQMYITSADCISGLGLAGIRVRVELTGTSAATINAGQFWAKINCDDYTGHYLGGHPTGLSGIIECVGTARTATSQYAVMAGVCGEVRPISGTVDAGGVICGLHAKIFGVSSEVTTGDVVGLFVQAIGGSAADIGILIGTHTAGAAWTTGLEFDSTYGAITTAIDIGACATGINITGACSTEAITISTQAVSIMTASLTNAGAGSQLNGIEIAWNTTTTYGANADYIRGTETFAVEALLSIGTDGTPAVVGAAGSHVGILTNINITAAITGDTDVVGGGYHVVTLSAVPTTDKGVISAVTAYTRNVVTVDGTTEIFGSRSVIYTAAASSAESPRQHAIEAAIVDKTTTRAVAARIMGILVTLEVADDNVGGSELIGICLEENGTLAATEGIKFQTGTWTKGIDFGDYCTTAIDIGDCTTGIAITGTSTTGINISGAAEYGVTIAWATTSVKGTGADPLYGSHTADSGIQGCVAVGTAAAEATVSGIGSHVAYISNVSLEVALEQFSIFGGAMYICTLGVAQGVVDAVACGVTGYIRNIDGGKMETVQYGVRGCIYTHTGQEGVRQSALHAAIIDAGSKTEASALHGLSMVLEATADSSCQRDAIYIQTVNSTQDWDTVINLQEDNFTFFASFNTNGGTSACKPAQVVQSSITDSTTADALVKIEIDGTAYYMVAFTKAHVTNESA